MATTISTMAMLKPKATTITNTSSSPSAPSAKPTIRTKSLPLPRGLTAPAPSPLSAAAVAGAVFSTLSHSDAALAAQQIAALAEGGGDSRGLALLLPVVPAIAWVLYNIFQPALNQLNRMRTEKGVVVGLGLGGGLAAAGLASAPSVSAGEMGAIADAASSGDNRGLLLLFVVAPAIAWVLFNILQPALNQLNRMRSG